MRISIMIFLIWFLWGTAIAQDLSPSRELPVKESPARIYESPAGPRQGGDTIEDATVISGLPITITGTTEGFVDDYDEECPYPYSTSPDVVYSFTPEGDVPVDVDLCGSGYDTKVYIYDAELNLIDCNDDAYFGDPCGAYVSKIENAVLLGGVTYSMKVTNIMFDIVPAEEMSWGGVKSLYR